jgi:hypothetical protein
MQIRWNCYKAIISDVFGFAMVEDINQYYAVLLI